jgi:hypothetical protein
MYIYIHTYIHTYSVLTLWTPPLQVLFDFEKSDPDSFTTIIMATIRNSAKDDLTNFSCKVRGAHADHAES